MRVVNQNKETNFFSNDKLPILLYAGSISNNPTWQYPDHSHTYCEIVYIFAGSGKYIIDGVSYFVSSGDILLYNKNVHHEEESSLDNPIVSYFLGIDNVFIKGLPQNILIAPGLSPIIHLGKYKNKIEEYINDIIFECIAQMNGYNVIIQSLLASLLVSLDRIIETESIFSVSSREEKFSNHIKEYIDHNYARDLTLSCIAQNLYVSPTYLSHTFKNETGTSPINYLINKRIDEAKSLLVNTQMTIQDISTKIGYENVTYFTKLFKKITGYTPAKFRDSSSDFE